MAVMHLKLFLVGKSLPFEFKGILLFSFLYEFFSDFGGYGKATIQTDQIELANVTFTFWASY